MTTLLSSPLPFIKNLFMHLWLSLSSIKFYERVFKKYNGYGISYILNLSLISSVICIAIFLYKLNTIQDYLKNNVMSEKAEHIDFILRQIPPIEYNGQKISVDVDEPILIKNKNGTNILAIDPNNQIMPNDSNKFPIILSQKEMIAKFIDSDGDVKNTFPIKVDQILGKEPKILTNEEIKSSLAELFDQAPRILIYMMFPLTGFLIVLNTLLDKAFFIIMIFFVTKFSGLNLSIKTCIRLTMYASGFYALFQFIFIFFAREYASILWVVQTWANILMILGILSATGKNYFFNKR